MAINSQTFEQDFEIFLAGQAVLQMSQISRSCVIASMSYVFEDSAQREHTIVAGYEGTNNTTDQLQHIHNCTQLVYGLCTQSLISTCLQHIYSNIILYTYKFTTDIIFTVAWWSTKFSSLKINNYQG